jgi:uncharacterized membrane protein
MGYIYAAIATVVGFQVAYFDDRLPGVVATHFDATGTANGFMERPAFIAFYVGLLLFVSFVFVGIALVVRRVPAELINLPNKDYWLAPDRADDTRAWLGREFMSFGVVVVLFLVAVMQQVFAANAQGGTPHLSGGSIWLYLVAMLAAVLVLLVRMIRRFAVAP